MAYGWSNGHKATGQKASRLFFFTGEILSCQTVFISLTADEIKQQFLLQ